MEFNDEQLPNENSICNMQHSYANEVSAYSSSSEIANILNQINWQENNQILSIMKTRAPSNYIKSFILGLIELNQADENQINTLFKLTPPRRNPPILSIEGPFPYVLKRFIKNETNLLNNLIQVIPPATKEQSENLLSIISRRLEALSMLTNFQNAGFFV